jgi:hypothetical protein
LEGIVEAKKLLCQKYSQEVDIEKNPCPHPGDYCRFRNSCVINRLCMDSGDCREKRRMGADDTR